MSDVRIVEVGPRDGLQNEKTLLPPATRVQLIEMLADAGLTHIEAGAFVSPRAVPSMAGSDQVLAALRGRDDLHLPVLVPNLKGFESARAAGAREIAIFAAATDGFSRANINCTIAESFDRFAPVMEEARAAGMPVRGYLSCVLGCPYEGAVDPGRVADLAARLADMGCQEISLGDTIGTGTPAATRLLLRAVAGQLPVARLAVHVHDTYGQALANVLVALEAGVTVIDSAVAGLGGCPYAPGAAGNLGTEDLVYMLKGAGLAGGVDLDLLAAAGRFACQALGRAPESRTARALAAR